MYRFYKDECQPQNIIALSWKTFRKYGQKLSVREEKIRDELSINCLNTETYTVDLQDVAIGSQD